MTTTTETAANLDRLAPILERLAAALERPPIPPEKVLWDAERVGEYLGVSPRTIAERWALQKDFPRPIMLGSDARAMKRWKAQEIIKWAERQR